ncbi:MAG: S8 family serine peptidase [Planctomycetes bacterium]|nr:S8 family serine peptidase [Planctomycetota bacterium]
MATVKSNRRTIRPAAALLLLAALAVGLAWTLRSAPPAPPSALKPSAQATPDEKVAAETPAPAPASQPNAAPAAAAEKAPAPAARSAPAADRAARPPYKGLRTVNLIDKNKNEIAEALGELLAHQTKLQGGETGHVDARLIPALESYRAALPAATPAWTEAANAAAAQVYRERFGRILAPFGNNARIPVHLDLAVDNNLVERIRGTGAEIAHVSKRFRSVDVYATLSEIDELAKIGEISMLKLQGGARRRTGSVPGDANEGMKVDLAVTDFLPGTLDGTGQKVGVLSDSIAVTPEVGGTISQGVLTGSNPQNSGDLPASIQVLLEGPPDDGIDEGAAMLEHIHDVAPGADLAFASAFISEASFADQVTALRVAGNCTITCDDIIYFAEAMFQDGPISQAVNGNFDAGVPHFTAAGNDADHGIEGVYVDIDSGQSEQPVGIDPLTGVDFHDWGIGGGTPSFLPITLPAGKGFTAVLQWNQPYETFGLGPGSSVDLDLYLFSAADVSSTQEANALFTQFPSGVAGEDPLEILDYTNSSGSSDTVFLALDHYSGITKSNVFFRIVFFLDDDNTTFGGGIVNEKTIYGHAAADKAFSIGAIDYLDIPTGNLGPDNLATNAEDFSSKGGLGVNGIPYFFDSTGEFLAGASAATPVRVDKPDMAAPDGANTTFFGSDRGADPDITFPNFFGTSAASPHAAGVAALLMQVQPTITPASLKELMQATAVDIVATDPLSGSGPDAFTGAGLVDAQAALDALDVDLELTKTADASLVLAGQTLTWTITVTNIGTQDTTATEVKVTDVLPDTFVAVSLIEDDVTAPAGSNVDLTLGTLTVDNFGLDAGESKTITIAAQVLISADLQEIENTATVTTTTNTDFITNNNTDTAFTIVGLVDDSNLYASGAAFGINWAKHAGGENADSFSLAGVLNKSGINANLTGAAMVVSLNGVPLTGQIALSSSGSGKSANGAVPKASAKVSPKNGKFSFKASSHDLRSFFPDIDEGVDGPGTSVADVSVQIMSGGLDVPTQETRILFDFTTRANSSTKGKYSFKTTDAVASVFRALKTSASEDGLGVYKFAASGVITGADGDPVIPDNATSITITIGSAAPVVIPFASLVKNGVLDAETSWTYSSKLAGPVAGLLKFQLSNAKRTFTISTDALAGTGIPDSTGGGLRHDLDIQMEVSTPDGDITFTTTVEVLRSSNTTGKWKG